MAADPQEKVGRLLQEARNGDAAALNELMPLVYDELHAIAHRQRRQWQGDNTLNTTALLHEVYIKLAKADETPETRAHFMAVAATAMRHLLVDQARRRGAQKRGGNVQKLSFEQMQHEPGMTLQLPHEKADEIMALDAALERLASLNPRQSRVVECRFFGCMTIEETAAVLGVSTATVKLDWAQARSWLFAQIQEAVRPGGAGA